MTGSERVFIDSAPFIYLVENHPSYYFPVANYFADAIDNGTTLFTSVITISEVYVKPYCDGNSYLLKDFEDVFRSLNFTIADIDFKIAELSATLRARYPFLRGMDSLQIATAMT